MSVSSLEVLNSAISANNPFNRELIVGKKAVWGQVFPDLPSLNAHASDGVFEAIGEIRKGQRKTVGITIKAEKGQGKSHVLSRIRDRLQEEGGALFVYMTDYNDLDRIKPEFLNILSSSLKQPGNQEVRQWQELAAAFANEALGKNHPPKHLVAKFAGFNPSQKFETIDDLTDKVIEARPDETDENPDLVRAILWTLSPKYASYAANWMGGKTISKRAADILGLPANPGSDAFERIRQLLDLIGIHRTIVICFDELDGTDQCSDSGLTRAQCAAGLAKDLYNTINRGVILTTMFPETWSQQVRSLAYAEAVIDRVGERTFELNGLDADQVVGLIGRYLQDFYTDNKLVPPHQVYPFEAEKLRTLGKERPPARRVLKWCQENWKAAEGSVIEFTPPKIDKVETAFKAEIEELDEEEFMDEQIKLATALIFGFNKVLGQQLEGVNVQEIDTAVVRRRANNSYINFFKVIGQENGQAVKIGVGVIQDSFGFGVQAGIRRLTDYEKYDFTRGCLVRSKILSPAAKKAHHYRDVLIKEKGGEWVVLKGEQIKPLLAIRAVYDKREDYELSEEEIFDFIRRQEIASGNLVIREILSAPSGEVSEDEAVDEDAALDAPDEPVLAASNGEDIEL